MTTPNLFTQEELNQIATLRDRIAIVIQAIEKKMGYPIEQQVTWLPQFSAAVTEIQNVRADVLALSNGNKEHDDFLTSLAGHLDDAEASLQEAVQEVQTYALSKASRNGKPN